MNKCLDSVALRRGYARHHAVGSQVTGPLAVGGGMLANALVTRTRR